jgi:hypothetical protein
MFHVFSFSKAERFGSGDGERKTWLTRQIAFEPLPASVLFALVWQGLTVPKFGQRTG